MKKFILRSIRFYQHCLSPDTGILKSFWFVGQRLPAGRQACRFRPTCSEYTYQAIEAYGIICGSWLGLHRIVKCNPWHAGGFDPIPRNI